MKLWGGRFAANAGDKMDDFHSSISFDSRMYREDIAGSIAHARMLGKTGIIEMEEAQAIIEGLLAIKADIESGRVAFDVAAEDIHMNIEALLISRIGDTGKKLHTARSRNDQVALDTRLYLMNQAKEILALLDDLLAALLGKAEAGVDTIMPGYTHMQRAQPVVLAHHLLAYFEMFMRDRERLVACVARTDSMPLGAGALAGTTFPIDREMVAKELGFTKLTENSLDAVSDRDFAIEFLAVASIMMMHMSRLCEELVIWSTGEFAFVEIDDAYSTGSSMMPQKKNPDAAELVRGKTGRVYGDLMALLTVMKGLPLTYNKDMQEDKEALFDGIDTVKGCLSVVTPMLTSLAFKPDAMRAAAAGGFTNATDLADYLVTKGVPFRTAHEIVGKAVLECVRTGRSLDELSLNEYKRLAPQADEGLFDAISLERCAGMRNVYGGTGRTAVNEALTRARSRLARLTGQDVGESD